MVIEIVEDGPQESGPSNGAEALALKIVEALVDRGVLRPDSALMEVTTITDVLSAFRFSAWTTEAPKVNGVYWWRADANDNEPDIHSVVAGKFYEIASRNGTTVEDYGGEWLGPIFPSDTSELNQRIATQAESLSTCHARMKLQKEAIEAADDALTLARTVIKELHEKAFPGGWIIYITHSPEWRQITEALNLISKGKQS